MMKSIRSGMAFFLMVSAAILMFLAFVDPVEVGAIRVFALMCYALGFAILPKKGDIMKDASKKDYRPINKKVNNQSTNKTISVIKAKDSIPKTKSNLGASKIKLEQANQALGNNRVLEHPTQPVINRGKVSYQKEKVTQTIGKELKERFIAFDVETTGLDSKSDKIIEVAAVLFENSKEVYYYSSLINPKMHIPNSASAINHITDSMVKDAPLGKDVYPKLVHFFGNALKGETLVCAHNASFDMNFLSEALMDLGYNGTIKCVDTLWLARNTLKGMPNYKQETLAKHYGIVNNNAHRALDDAITCGKLLVSLLAEQDKTVQQEKAEQQALVKKTTPSQAELEVCAVIQDCLEKNNCDISYLRFRKNAAGYVSSKCLYSFSHFKFAKKGNYIIIPMESHEEISLPKSPCTATEGGTDYIRVFFSNPADLYPLEKVFLKEYQKAYKEMHLYIDHDKDAFDETVDYINSMCQLSHTEVQSLLRQISEKQYGDIVFETKVEIKREDVAIQPNHSRCPLSDIKNKDDFNKGFVEGYPFWEKGEVYRKQNENESAIKCYDKARYYGYDAPALYTSYAMAYHKLKDYDNEIAILEEFLKRNKYVDTGRFEARRNKAVELLYKRQEKEKRLVEKETAKAEKTVEKKPSLNRTRSIIQLDDNGNIIKEFGSIVSASKEVGVSSKSIRDAAKGVQKHAGGYVWKYKNEGG